MRVSFQIVVSDMARALAFYRRLGFDIPASADTEPHVAVDLPGGNHLAWDTEDTVRSFLPGWRREEGNMMGLAVHLGTPAEVDKLFAEVVADGGTVRKEPWDAFWGMRYALVRDPDGNPVDLCAEL
jgi:catechol 2,3-dioxygenase-like lactoylglutathione lyase family enzyme